MEQNGTRTFFANFILAAMPDDSVVERVSYRKESKIQKNSGQNERKVQFDNKVENYKLNEQ